MRSCGGLGVCRIPFEGCLGHQKLESLSILVERRSGGKIRDSLLKMKNIRAFLNIL